MNRISKVVLAVILIVCVAAAAYFIFLRPDDALPPEPPATDAPGPTEEPGETSPPPETEPPEGSDPPEESTPPVDEPAGTLQELNMPGDTILRFWLDETVYTHGGSYESDIYVEDAVENSASRLEISLIEGTPEEHRPNFLEGYFTAATEINIDGLNYIPGTEIAGEQVSGTDGTRSAMAWLVDMGTGTMAVVICYETQAQADAYFKILDTMELVPV